MNKKILLIEDDNFIRDMYSDELLKNGFVVTACPNGEMGLEALKKNQFDLMLLDILLPGINGLEVLEQTKLDPKTKGLMIILLTNLGHETVIKQGFELGAAGYLIKSAYNPDQIITEIKSYLDGTNISLPQM